MLQFLPERGSSVLVPQALHSLKLARHLEGTSGLKLSLLMAGFVFDNKIYLKKQNLNILLFIANFLSPGHLVSASGQEVRRQQQKILTFPFSLLALQLCMLVSLSVSGCKFSQQWVTSDQSLQADVRRSYWPGQSEQPPDWPIVVMAHLAPATATSDRTAQKQGQAQY